MGSYNGVKEDGGEGYLVGNGVVVNDANGGVGVG